MTLLLVFNYSYYFYFIYCQYLEFFSFEFCLFSINVRSRLSLLKSKMRRSESSGGIRGHQGPGSIIYTCFLFILSIEIVFYFYFVELSLESIDLSRCSILLFEIIIQNYYSKLLC